MPVKDMPPKCAATLDTFDSELPPRGRYRPKSDGDCISPFASGKASHYE